MPNRRRTDGVSDARALRVLIVDDDDNYRAWIAALLRRLGFLVTTAADGSRGLDILDDVPAFDLFVIDCEMPRIDGLRFIEQARNHERGNDAYAVMLTGRSDVETKIAALRLGFDDFVTKASTDIEIVAKLGAARRVVSRQHRLDATVRELYGLATRDELTGLANRRFFFSEADRLLALGLDVSLVLFDLDRFKHVNDTYGHLTGDAILHDVGTLFLRTTRAEDLIGRYGGDEFVMLVSALDVESIEMLAARIAAEIAQLRWHFRDEEIAIDVTTGIASACLLPSPTLPQLLDVADRDLYKNKWVRHNPDADPSLYEYPPERDGALLDFQPKRDERSQANGD